MKGKNLLKVVSASAVMGTAAAEVIHYLLTNRNADLSFITDNFPEPDDREKALVDQRKADQKWAKSKGLLEYSMKSFDNLELKAYLLKTEKPSNKYALCIHGYRAFGLQEFDSVMRYYHEQGINVFFIDQRSCGKSEGKYITYGMKEHLDCLDWLRFMIGEFGNDIEIFLHGVSLGSATVMLMCGKELPENVKFAVSDCGYSTLKGELFTQFKPLHLPRELSYQLFRISCFLHQGLDPESCRPIKAIEKCNIPIIFAYGKADTVVPYEMGLAVYDACGSKEKQFIAVDGANHAHAFFQTDELKNTITEYIERYL